MAAPAPKMSPSEIAAWVFGGLTVAIVTAVLVIFVILPAFNKPPSSTSPPMAPFTIPSGGCQCYSDISARSPGSSPSTQADINLENRDNKTFCGYQKDGFLWGCKPTDCSPACV